MKKSIYLFIILVGWSSAKTYAQAKTEQDYILVDARVRVYHKDGTRTYKEYQPFKTQTLELLPNFNKEKSLSKLSKYGGLMADKTKFATGFFHVKKIDGRWWGIDPLGYKYFNISLNSINTGKSKGSKVAFKEKFGNKENWIHQTVEMLQNHGFNCAGSWSDVEAIIEANKTLEKPLAYTVNWNFMSSYGRKRGGTHQQAGHTGYPKDAIFVFDPEFKTFCDEHAKQLLKYKDDPNLFGHFSDNEMPFKQKALDNYLKLPKNEHGYKAAIDWLKENGITKAEITDTHRDLFMAYVGDTYFSIVSKAIKKYDPNHMYIGARFYSEEKNHAAFMKAAGKHLDIISNNYYNHWTPDKTDLVNWTKWSGRPFIITEYYVKGEDSGMGNTSGAGWIVRTQKDRGLFYQNYNLALLASKNCVGWHYFKYQDNDPTAKGVDPSNIDANKGIVTSDYKPWTAMLEKMKALNNRVYDLINYFDHHEN
ncbi:agarase [Wenyingzhuangia fucanilytica]|nr:agarase [Wenyingzhuangia fucanilytica]